jgi:hypothetical protein
MLLELNSQTSSCEGPLSGSICLSGFLLGHHYTPRMISGGFFHAVDTCLQDRRQGTNLPP